MLVKGTLTCLPVGGIPGILHEGCISLKYQPCGVDYLLTANRSSYHV